MSETGPASDAKATNNANAAAKPAETPAAAPHGEPAEDTTDWKAQSRKWEARAKENSTAAEKLRELEDRDKTEAQKSADRLAELERENSAYKLAEQRQSWAKGIVEGSHIPATALRGDTEEELRAHFAELKTLIPEPTTRTVVPGDAERQTLALNGDGLENALLNALKR